MGERFDDLPVLERLAVEVRSAAERAEAARVSGKTVGDRHAMRRRRFSPRVFAVIVALLVPSAATAAGATLLALRGSVIPAPRAVAPEQTPRPGTGRMVGITAADPAPGKTRWTMRLAVSRTGLLCSTVGQLVDGRFGIVGLDGRFRRLAPQVADACSVRRVNAATLAGARVFDARRDGDVRTIVSGVAGTQLRAVEVETIDEQRAVPVSPEGAFVTALRGLPEDLAVRVRLRFADGHVEAFPFGVAPLVFPDPDGGRAWRVQSGSVSGDDRTCVSVSGARHDAFGASSPSACGDLGDPRRRRGVFFAIRRLTPAERSDPTRFGGRWGDTPPRLLVYGAGGSDVTDIRVQGPPGQRRTGLRFEANGSFAYMFGPEVRPGDVQVTVRFRGGRTIVRRDSTNLTTPPGKRGG